MKMLFKSDTRIYGLFSLHERRRPFGTYCLSDGFHQIFISFALVFIKYPQNVILIEVDVNR